MKLLADFSNAKVDVIQFLKDNPQYIDHFKNASFKVEYNFNFKLKNKPGIYETEEENYYWDGITHVHGQMKLSKYNKHAVGYRLLYVLTPEGEQALKDLVIERAFT